MNTRIDHALVRAASQRSGMRFKMDDRQTAPARKSNARCKLSRADVRYMREWAGRGGWGLSRIDQARELHKSFPFVAVITICEVLNNGSWFDPTYTPKKLDAAFMGAMPVPALVLNVMEGA